MQLRQLFVNDPSDPQTFDLTDSQSSLASNPNFVAEFGALPDAFLPTESLAHALRFFFETWVRRVPDPVPVAWICGPAGTGKTTLLNTLSQAQPAVAWPQGFSKLTGQLNALRAHPPHMLRLCAKSVTPRFGYEGLAVALLRRFNADEGFAANSIEIAALERWLSDRGVMQQFAQNFCARTSSAWVEARESDTLLREDIVKALAHALNESRERAEKDYESAIAKPQEPDAYLQQLLMRRAEREGAQQRVLILIDDFDQLFGADPKLTREALGLLSRFACDSHGRVTCVVASRRALDTVLHDLADFAPAGIHSFSLGPRAALELLYGRWLQPNRIAHLSLAALAPEASHPFSEYVLNWLARILAAQPDIHVLGLFAQVLREHAGRAAVDLLGPAALLSPLLPYLPASTAQLLQATLPSLPAAQAEILAALALAPLGGLARLSEHELAKLAQARLADPVIPSQALSALEKAGWLRRLEGAVALSLPESQLRQSVGESVSISLRERMRLLAELLFDDLLGARQHVRFRNGRDYPFNRLCDSHAHGTASNELALMLLTPLAPEHADFDEFHAVLRSAEGGGQALLRIASIDTLNERLTQLARARQTGMTESAEQLRAALLCDLSDAFEQVEVFVAGKRLVMTAIEPQAVIDSALIALIEAVYPRVNELSHQQSEALAMIRVVLGGRELPIGENGEAAAALDQYFQQHLGQLISLADLVQRFRSRPFGWPDLEIVLLAARLVNSGKLSVRVDGHAARPAESAEAFTNAALWSRVSLVRAPAGVTDDMLVAAQWAQTLFARTFALDKSTILASRIRAEVEAWRNELAAMAQPDAFAGSHDAREALSELRQLSLLREGDEFLSAFCAQAELLSDIGADLIALRNSRAQLGPAYDRLRTTLVEIQHNIAALRRDPSAEQAIERLQALQNSMGRPESATEIDRLCEVIAGRNFELIADAREQAMLKIEQAVSEVQAQFLKLDIPDEQQQRALHGLNSLRERVDLENLHAALLGFAEEAAHERDLVLERLNRQITNERPAISEQHMLLTVVRPGRLAAGMIFEQEADLDEYFEKVREALKPMLKAGMRVRLE